MIPFSENYIVLKIGGHRVVDCSHMALTSIKYRSKVPEIPGIDRNTSIVSHLKTEYMVLFVFFVGLLVILCADTFDVYLVVQIAGVSNELH